MPSGVKTSVEKNIWKITFPSGTIRYRVEFAGKGTELYALEKSLTKAREIKAAHLKKHPHLVPMDPEAKRLRSIERSKTTKVPETRFIEEYVTRPGTYSIRISRAKKAGGKKTTLSDTVVGLANAKKREKELIAEMEKLTGRGIDDFAYKPPNPIYKKALADVKKQMTKWNKLGYYPKDILVKISDKYKFPYVKDEGANRQLSQYVKKAGLIDYDNLQALSSKYITAVENYKKYKGDKTKVGVKKSILEKVGLPSKAADVATFRAALNRIGSNVVEDIKLEGEQTQRTITKKLGKQSALNIEDYLSGKKLGDLIITGKKGSLIDKMHLADKQSLINVGEMGYGSAKLNQMLGGGFQRAQGAERHRTALDKHMNKIIKKFKGKPDAMYTISAGPDSFDQRKFKNALEKEFGKTKGKVPLAQYIDKILNEEARLMGTATDGLITTRQINPITLERMKPSYGLSGSRTLPPVGKITDNITLQELGLEKKQAGFKKVTPRLKDFDVSANLAFQSANINIKNMKLSPARMNSIVNSIDKMLAAGLQNAKYEEISKLAKQCTLLRAEGGRVAFADGGPCAQAQKAVRALDNSDIAKIGSNIDDAMQGPMGKLRDVSRTLIQSPLLKKGGKFGAIAAAGAAGAGLVKTFMNDDPTTYLSNEDQQKNMLIEMVTGPMVDKPDSTPDILDWQLPVLGATAAAGTAAVAPSTIEASRSARFGKKPSGYTKTALKTLGRGLAATGTPLGLAAFEPLHIAGQVQAGDSLGEIATNPWNYAGLAFADDLSKFATKGLGPNIAKAMRLGLSPAALKVGSRFLGIPGLALSLGISGYEMYDDYKKKRGIFSEE